MSAMMIIFLTYVYIYFGIGFILGIYGIIRVRKLDNEFIDFKIVLLQAFCTIFIWPLVLFR